MKKIRMLTFAVLACLSFSLLIGCSISKEERKNLDVEEAKKTYMSYYPTIKEDVEAVTDEDVLKMCAIDQEETELFNEKYSDGKTRAEIYNASEEIFKYLPDNAKSCSVEKWIKEDETENYVFLEYEDDKKVKVGVTYDSQGLRDIYIYFQNENKYVSISDELAFEVLNFGVK